MIQQIAIQPHTLREECKSDFPRVPADNLVMAEIGTGSIISTRSCRGSRTRRRMVRRRCRRSPMDSVEISLANLKRMMEEIG